MVRACARPTLASTPLDQKRHPAHAAEETLTDGVGGFTGRKMQESLVLAWQHQWSLKAEKPKNTLMSVEPTSVTRRVGWDQDIGGARPMPPALIVQI